MTRPDGDAGSLPFALFISLIGVTLSALLIPVILVQIGSSRVEANRSDALEAAETGMDVAKAQIRSAYTGTDANGNPQGDVTKLPCNALTGDLGGGSRAHYRVTVDYFAYLVSPSDYLTASGQDNTGWIAAHSLPCRTGSPMTALLRAQGVPDSQALTGSCTTGARCLRSLYTFTTTNQTITGGRIHVYRTPTSTDLCLSAGSATLTAAQLTGTALIVAGCDPNKSAQVFSWNSDLTITLAGSRSSDLPDGMCLDSRAASGQAVEFDPCANADRATQRWVFTGTGAFEAPDGTCLRVLNPNLDGSLVLHDTTQCAATSYSNVAAFTPDAAAGAGAAGWGTGQIADSGQFGRCLTVPRGDYRWHTGSADPSLNDGPYLVSLACKQTSPVVWNQIWTVPGTVTTGAGVTGPISTTAPGTDPPQGSPAGTYCLQSPASAAAAAYVKVIPCATPAPAHTTWTVTGYTGTSATSYLIRDDSSPALCLAPQTPSERTADPYPFTDNVETAKLVVRTCDGSALQKWNLPADGEPRAAIGRLGEK